MDDKYEIVQFRINDLELDVLVSFDDKRAWLSINEMCLLFGKDKSVISRHIKKSLKEEQFDGQTVSKNATVRKEGNKIVRRLIDYYSLDVAMSVGIRAKSKNAFLLRDFIRERFESFNRTNNSGSIVVFENGNVSLPVQISPEENTVWLDKEGLSSLFGTSRQNVEYHIANIYGQGELEEGATCKEILQVQVEAGRKVSRLAKLYNLDLIISLGYRVNTKNGIEFRIWATKVLKEYLLKGYVINESRTLVTNENYINLIHKVDGIDARLSKLESVNGEKNNRVFFDGTFFDARSFLKGIFAKANEEIILVDPYADILALDYLKEKKDGVCAKVFVSAKSKLTQGDVDAFQAQYGPLSVLINDAFHDRFIVLDKKDLYHVGASLNYVGRKTFALSKIEDEDYVSSLLKRLKA